MWQILGLLVVVGAMMVALKLAIAVLFLAGLIFRTKETLGLMLVLGVIAGFSAHPIIGFSLLGVGLAVSLYYKHKEESGS
jgi:predicted membrane protein